MNFSWKFVIDAGVISVAILIASIIRAKVPFFQKFLIPNALTSSSPAIISFSPPSATPRTSSASWSITSSTSLS
jgi:Na+/glutamate symporter